MMTMQTPECLSMTELIEACRSELHQFLHRQPNRSTRYTYELFRRALEMRDDYAWLILYEHYKNLVSAWIVRACGSTEVTYDEQESLVNQAFAKFAHSLRRKTVADFGSVEALLGYLRCCARSVAYDELRARQLRPLEEALEGMEQESADDDPITRVLADMAARDLWFLIAARLKGEEERVLLSAVVGGARPADIQRCYPHLFASTKDVYRIQRNMVERLKRCQPLLQEVKGGIA